MGGWEKGGREGGGGEGRRQVGEFMRRRVQEASSQGCGSPSSSCSAYSHRLLICVESRCCQEGGMETGEG